MDNINRAVRAFRAVDYYNQGEDLDAETAIGDLLCDLRHAADTLGVTWEELLDRADMHYQAEIRGE